MNYQLPWATIQTTQAGRQEKFEAECRADKS